MPIYEYQCTACDHRIEALQKLNDPPLEVCEACGGALKRLVSSPAFQFKGSGWYVTDYARKGGSSSSSSTKSGDGGEAKSGSTAAEGGGSKSGSAAPAPSASGGKDD